MTAAIIPHRSWYCCLDWTKRITIQRIILVLNFKGDGSVSGFFRTQNRPLCHILTLLVHLGYQAFDVDTKQGFLSWNDFGNVF